jgi:hypothetical protein
MADTDTPRQEKAQRQEPEVYDGMELGDEDLEMVVGGLSPEASAAYVEYLQDESLRTDPARRLDRLRRPRALWPTW